VQEIRRDAFLAVSSRGASHTQVFTLDTSLSRIIWVEVIWTGEGAADSGIGIRNCAIVVWLASVALSSVAGSTVADLAWDA
jgi:hypothetical protein